MNNISFKDPYLLIVGSVLLIITIVSFFLFIKKDNYNKHNVTSFILHVIMVTLITLAISGMTLKRVITETDVYVVADCSYSSNYNLDTVDEYIGNLSKNLPKNSKMGIVTFGKDQELLVKLGDKITSVKNHGVDQSETDIEGALSYTATLFEDGVIKRIVLITDGKNTSNVSLAGISEDLENQGIYIDCIYLDNNIKDGFGEIQISGIEYNENTYCGKDEIITIKVLSNTDCKSTISLYKEGELVKEVHEPLVKGTNNVVLSVDTAEAGTFKYHVEAKPYKEEATGADTSTLNNTYLFTQCVKDTMRILFVSDSVDEKLRYESMNAGKNVTVDYYINDHENVPTQLEELTKYDEFVFDDVDISLIANADSFVTNLETCVSEYGKSLITIGNTHIQNGEKNSVLKEFGSFLPVNFDNEDSTRRLYGILLDISKSMFQISHLEIAKTAACQIIDMLGENDDLVVVAFYGDNEVVYNINRMTASGKEAAKDVVQKLVAKQATSLSGGLETIYNIMSPSILDSVYQKKEVMLITDGKSYTLDVQNSEQIALDLRDSNVRVNVMYVADYKDEKIENNAVLQAVASNSNGSGYTVSDLESANNLILNEIQDEVTQNHKTGDFTVSIRKPKHDLVDSVDGKLENVNEFYTSALKTTAVSVVEVTEKKKDYPLYATWEYGNGIVSCLTTNLSTQDSWFIEDSNSMKLLSNVSDANIPSTQIYTPYLISFDTENNETRLVVSAPDISSQMNVKMDMTSPSGKKTIQKLVFNNTGYVCLIDTNEIGTYTIEVEINDGVLTYNLDKYLSNSYLKEYDMFETYDSYSLYSIVNNNGQVSEDGHLSISNEGLESKTYKYEFKTLFIIISVILFVIDVAIRKLRWQDIKSFFGKKTKKEARK